MEVNPDQPKFEARGFKKEDEAPNMEPGEQEVTPEQADAIIQGGLGAEEITFEDPDAPKEPQAAAEPEKPQAKIKIGTREFANAEEAWSYAQELEQEKIANDAFRQGIEVASKQPGGNPPEAQKPADPDDKFDEEFYADPKGYIRKVREQIAAQVKGELTQQEQMKKRNDETWAKFYSDYPDLNDSKDLVEYTLQQNWEQLKHADTGPALKIIAEKVRERRKSWVQSMLPAQELPKVKQVGSPGNGIQVTRQQESEPDLNFVQQHRKLLGKKRTARPRG